ncbi:hypothetical protein NR798_47175 [Archangium gephyra]|uniref:hypothetical protein n=1 Tax=Archangium gephyra TaxID=48 RepID=UPI0035D3F282
MNPGQWLDLKCQRLAVPDTSDEWKSVRGALNAVEQCIEQSRVIRIAERFPCGSFEKDTMLPNRKEADLVVVLADPPTSQTLDALRQVLAEGLSRMPYGIPLAHPPQESFKAIQLQFANGVMVDVLPVAKQGVTPAGPAVPRKLRVALSGPEHVRWFERNAHGSVIHNVVRALKHFRELHRVEWEPLFSFAIEVLAVTILEPHKDKGLAWCFRKVLDELGQGWLLNGRVLQDPARPGNDLLMDLDEPTRQRLTDAARRAVTWVDAEQWSEVFPPERQPPRVDTNLGGRTLA